MLFTCLLFKRLIQLFIFKKNTKQNKSIVHARHIYKTILIDFGVTLKRKN